VVIYVIHIRCINFFKAKRHPPIPWNPNGVMISLFALKGVNTKARQIHIMRAFRLIKGRKYSIELLNVVGWDAFWSPSLIQFVQALVLKDNNHVYILGCRVSLVNIH